MPDQRQSFRVTDPELDAPDGAIVDGYQRHADSWEPMPELTSLRGHLLSRHDLDAFDFSATEASLAMLHRHEHQVLTGGNEHRLDDLEIGLAGRPKFRSHGRPARPSKRPLTTDAPS